MSSVAETALRRTSLVRPPSRRGAQARAVRRVGDAGPVPRDPRGALAVRTAVGVFDVSHMGQVGTRGPEALEFLQRLLSNDIRRIPEGGAQYSVMCREDGGVLDDLFTYRLAERAVPHRHQRRQPREGPGLAASSTLRSSTSTCVDVADELRDAGGAGPGRPCAGRPPRRRRAAAADALLRADRGRACDARLRDGYTGEDGVELLLDPDDAPAVWDALVAGGATPAGLGARDTLRLEVCFHLYGNDLSSSAARSRRGSAGAARRRPDSSARTRSPPSARPGRPRSSCRS